MININDRLHSTAVDEQNPANNHVVTSAAEIFDDNKGKQQAVINQETDNALANRYTKDETYSKSELNNLITTPDVGYVTVTATDQTTDVTDLLPAEGSADTIYRVAKWDGTQYDVSAYTEYGWNGSQYVPLDTKQNGIDAVPAPGSHNLVESGGVYALAHLCNIPDVNDFVMDIVLKEGVDDPQSENYIDIANSDRVYWQDCIYKDNGRYASALQVRINGDWVTLFYIERDTKEEIVGQLLEYSSNCYVVLKGGTGTQGIASKPLTFYRNVGWASLIEHPIISGLLTERDVDERLERVEEVSDFSYETINGYSDKIKDELLTSGKYWTYSDHIRNDLQGFVSNDVIFCRGGDVFTITGTGGSSTSRLYVFADANGNNIEGYVAEAGEVQENYSIVAPDDAVYFYFSALSNKPYKLQKQSSYEGILNELTGIHNDISNLSSSAANGEAAYEELFGQGQSPDAITLENGYFWFIRTTPPVISAPIDEWTCNPAESVPCEPGDAFTLTGEGGRAQGDGLPNSYLWAFANSNGVITRHAEINELHTTPFEVVAQEGEVQFYMSSFSSRNPTLFKKSATTFGLVKRVGDIGAAVSAIIGDIEDIQEEIDNIPVSVCKMFNVPVNLKKPNLKVLDLGNSYTADAVHYLKNILDAAGITTGFSLYTCVRGGSSFRTWVNLYKEADNNTYYIERKAGDLISGVAQGQRSGLDNSWFVDLLKKDWDIILIHQASLYAAQYDEWTGNGDAGGLAEYLRILRTYCPQATIGFYVVHSYPSWRAGNLQGGANSTERWQNIAKASEHLKSDYGIDFIIPYGTAVENLRLTSLNLTDPVDSTKNNDFSADGTHLTSGIGDYVAACAYFEALFAPRYNVTVLGNTYTNENVPVPQPGDSDYYDGRGVPVQITAANALLAQRAAILAVNDMFHLNNPEIEGFIPVNTDTKAIYIGDGNPSNIYTKAEVDALITGKLGTNGAHPILAGYQMIADSLYR